MEVLDELFQSMSVQPQDTASAEQFLLILLIAFVIGQLNGWFYRWSHRGLSYSRTFTQALVLITIISALSMSLIAARPLVAIGLIGGLAIIRFRTVVRDTRDTAHLFLCLICGMATGFGFFAAAIIGALVVNLVSQYLHHTGFGAWQTSDSLLRFQIAISALDSTSFESLLRRFCRRCEVISVDQTPMSGPDGAQLCQCSYKVRLRDPEKGPDLVAELKREFQIDAVHLLVEQEYEDVA